MLAFRRIWATVPRKVSFDDEATVYPGHMGITTLGTERATNPFLRAFANR